MYKEVLSGKKMLVQGLRKAAKRVRPVSIAVLLLALLIVVPLSGVPKAAAAAGPTYRYTKTFELFDSNAYAFGAGTATDSAGNVYIDGYFIGTVTFDGPGGSDTITAQNYEAFVTKYNKDGTYQWTRIMDSNASSSSAFAHNLAVDSSDNVYVSGSFNGTVVFDGTGGSHSDTAASGNTSSYLTKLRSDGGYEWTKTFDVTNGSAFEAGVAIDHARGIVYETGQYHGTVAFDGPGGTSTQDSGIDDGVYLVKYNLNGGYISTQTLNGDNGSSVAHNILGGSNVAVDSDGSVYVGGSCAGIIDVTGTAQSFTSTNIGSFIVKFNADGSFGWSKAFDASSGSSTAANASVAAFGTHVYMVGKFSGTAVFDGPGGAASVTSANQTSYVTAYSTSGAYEWTRTIDTSAGAYDARATVVTTDSLGDIYIGGTFYGELVFDGPGGSDTQGTGITTSTDYLTKLGPGGAYEWTRVLYPDGGTNGSVQDAPYMGVATDNLGNVFLSGDFYGQMTFDGQGGSDTINANTDGAFLTSYHAFISPPPAQHAAAATTPSAPNTGFEMSPVNSLYGAAGYGIVAAGLLFVSAKIGRRTRNSSSRGV